MWNDEIKREEGVSLDRWKSKNILWLKKYESDFRIKYADKNPFIKETETEINIQTYPQRRPVRNKSPQGRNLNNPDRLQEGNKTMTTEREIILQSPEKDHCIQQLSNNEDNNNQKKILKQSTNTEGKTL